MTKVSNYWNVLKPSAGSICLFPLGCASLRMRVQKMPVREDAVLNDLQTAIMYWHGRDRSCRPILVWRMEKVYALGAFPASFGLKSGVASQVWFRVHIDIEWYIYIYSNMEVSNGGTPKSSILFKAFPMNSTIQRGSHMKNAPVPRPQLAPRWDPEVWMQTEPPGLGMGWHQLFWWPHCTKRVNQGSNNRIVSMYVS